MIFILDLIREYVNKGFRIFCTGLLGAGDGLMGSFIIVSGIVTDGLGFGVARRWFCVIEVFRKRSFTRTFVFFSKVISQHINTDNLNNQPYHLALDYHASYMDHHPAKNQHNSYNFYD